MVISIILPVYNVAPFIIQTLDSITAQTFTDYEVIIVNDGSSDDTGQIVETYLHRNNLVNFKLLNLPENKGISAALNLGVSHSRGNFIARVDGDDLMLPERLELQLSYLAEKQVDLVGCSFLTINENNDVLGSYYFPTGAARCMALLKWGSSVSHIWLARKEVYNAVGDYRCDSVEDYDFLLRATKMGFKIDNIPNYFGMKIRLRAGNTVSRFGLRQRKLFNYVRKVNFHDKLFDTYVVDRIRTESSIMSRLHRVSDHISNRAARCSGKGPKGVLHLLAAVVSPYKAQYYMRSLLYRIGR